MTPDDPLPAGATIVVADDDNITRRNLSEMLARRGYVVDAFADGQAAVERVGQGGVDLVLLDIMMPRLNGLEACRLLKAMTADSFLPVVLVTVKTDTGSRVEGLKIGADDYVSKPFDEEELAARVEAMLRIKRLHDHVAAARERLERLSVHDPLTGLHNYRYLNSRIGSEFERAERFREPLACVVLDIDNLAAINSRSGRVVGDQVVQRVADILRAEARAEVVVRYGGDEFLVLLPSTQFSGAVMTAERLWRGVAERGNVADVVVTASVGLSLYPSTDVKTKDALLRCADAALLRAKSQGGNRVCVFQQQGRIYTPLAGPARSRLQSEGDGE